MHCLLLVEMKLDDYNEMSSCSSSSIGCLSADSSSNSVSSNMVEDADDDASSSSANGVEQMFQLSDLMSQLPIKRGLSRYYNGKSDSFKNLTSIKSLEDVPKLSSKGRSSNNRCHKFYTTPKSKISKSNNKASTWISGRSNRLTTSSNTRICTRFIHA